MDDLWEPSLQCVVFYDVDVDYALYDGVPDGFDEAVADCGEGNILVEEFFGEAVERVLAGCAPDQVLKLVVVVV